MSNDKFVLFAEFLADEAKKITTKYFRSQIKSTAKSDESPVTIADRETESHLRQLISSKYPEHNIIGEEEVSKVTDSEYEWIIDPIDGTKNFIAGFPLYGCLIALLKKNIPVLSIIDAPALEERWISDGKNTFYENSNFSCVSTPSTKKELTDVILCSTDYSMFSNQENKIVDKLRKEVKIIRYNGDCYLTGLLVNGHIDIIIESDLKIYDFMPLVPIIEGSGAIITDWQGNKLTKNSSGQILSCANKELHKKALQVLNN